VIALIRHGQSTTNAEGLLVGRSDPHLTELGERQARALAPWLNDVTQVWVSPLARARETAALAMPGRPVVVKDSFIELDYGTFEGQSAATMAGESWRALEFAHDARFGDGESLAAVDERVCVELEFLFEDKSSLLRLADQVGRRVGPRCAGVNRLAHAPRERLAHHGRSEGSHTPTDSI
jgi:probable phosphoglycerate mutase